MLWLLLPVIWTAYRGVMYQVKFVSFFILSILSLLLYGVTTLTWNTILPYLWRTIKRIYLEFPLELKVALNVLVLLLLYENRGYLMSMVPSSGLGYTPLMVQGYTQWVWQRMSAVVVEAVANTVGTPAAAAADNAAAAVGS